MLKSVEGVFRDGIIELLELPPSSAQGRVIVTFLESGWIDLRDRGIDESQAAELSHRLNAFGEDWSRPEMDAYDVI